MENGLFSGSNTGLNSGDPTIADRFTTAMIEGERPEGHPGRQCPGRGAVTFYSGVPPSGYIPMSKEGGIVLGVGGDNSKSSAGTFYEGVMTYGYPTAATEAVQANITSVGYTTFTGGGTGATRPHRVRPQQLQVRGQQQRQRHQRQQGADLGRATATPPHRTGPSTATAPSPSTAAAGVGHHRRQLLQRHPHRVVDLQRRRQPAMAGLERGARQPGTPASASTTPAPTPPTGRSSSCTPATAAATRNGRCLNPGGP